MESGQIYSTSKFKMCDGTSLKYFRKLFSVFKTKSIPIINGASTMG
jgi:hypothetical protein